MSSCFISVIRATATTSRHALSYPRTFLRCLAIPTPHSTRSFSSEANQDEHISSDLARSTPLLEYPPNELKGVPKQLLKADVQLYLYPLLCHGWKLNSTSDQSLALTRSLVFRGPISARKFLTKLLEAEETLWHHVDSIRLNGEKRPALDVTVQTHDTVPPGLSLQDVRLAVNLEKTYRGGEFGPVKGRLAVQNPTAISTEDMEKLLNMFP